MALDTEHLLSCIKTLETSLQRLQQAEENSIDYEVFRNATIKGFELTLETAGKLLRKVLKSYTGSPRTTDQLTYREVLRHAAKHDLLDAEAVERWFIYRNNHNNTAHDYGKIFADETLKLFPDFVEDAKQLEKTLKLKLSDDNA